MRINKYKLTRMCRRKESVCGNHFIRKIKILKHLQATMHTQIYCDANFVVVRFVAVGQNSSNACLWVHSLHVKAQSAWCWDCLSFVCSISSSL